jgi:hypothetical protein
MALTQYLLQQLHITALRRLQHRRPLAHLSCSLCTRLTMPILLERSARNVPTALWLGARTEREVATEKAHRASGYPLRQGPYHTADLSYLASEGRH